jgi:hypothetical protein
MAVKTIKHVSLTLGTKTVECQLTRAALIDSPTTEDLTTFCGTETVATANYTFEMGGLQDWGLTNPGSVGPPAVPAYDAVCDIIHTAYKTDPVSAIECVLTVGTATRTFDAKPINDVAFGGDAGGSGLTFTQTLDVDEASIVEGTVP